jgi:hypothetical protein
MRAAVPESSPKLISGEDRSAGLTTDTSTRPFQVS